MRITFPATVQLTHSRLSVFVQLLLLLLLCRFSRVQLCATPETAAHQAPQSMGFSRQGHWSGLPFPSPVREAEQVYFDFGAEKTTWYCFSFPLEYSVSILMNKVKQRNINVLLKLDVICVLTLKNTFLFVLYQLSVNDIPVLDNYPVIYVYYAYEKFTGIRSIESSYSERNSCNRYPGDADESTPDML
ncbi:hypothetical protein MG293_000884 [Ovis ammon polii]|uniref:Uncharacterized protein n=1 Tax=Ovis ammon polii TaxID=230172 RepID=A0AAD4UQQ6_OVIAM|nr:hypothetical protein MG293_000884 [Ovis ammon polii]